MGCDIHIVVERKLKLGSTWTGIMSTDVGRNRPTIARRRYHLFSNLAGVRGSPEMDKGGQYPNFIPEDVSKLSLEQMGRYGSDGHSHSFMSVDKFIQIWRNTVDDFEEARHKHLSYDLFGFDAEDFDKFQYRVVFWFDN